MSSGKGLPSHFWNRNNVRSILPGLRRKITGLLLSGPKSSFQIKVNFGFHLEIKVWSLEEDWRGTESKLLEVQCEVSEVIDDLGCCDVWPTIMFYQVKSQYSHIPGDFGVPLCFHLLTSFMEMLISFSSRTLAPAKTTSKWFADHNITVLDWPANMPDLKPIWNLWDIFKRKMRQSIQQYRWAEGSVVPQQCHRLIASMPHLTDAGVCAKGPSIFFFFHLSHTRLYREYITSSEMYYLHLTHPKWTHTLSSGQPCCGARGAVGGSVPCSRTPQSWYWRRRERWYWVHKWTYFK